MMDHDQAGADAAEFTLAHAVALGPAPIAVIGALSYTVMSAGADMPGWMLPAVGAVIAASLASFSTLNRRLSVHPQQDRGLAGDGGLGGPSRR